MFFVTFSFVFFFVAVRLFLKFNFKKTFLIMKYTRLLNWRFVVVVTRWSRSMKLCCVEGG